MCMIIAGFSLDAGSLHFFPSLSSRELSEMKVRAPDGDWHLNLIKLEIHLTI